ncbi:MAG: hypothetical protein CO119_05760 [Flavobacteriales bacterium CG_4_9_14_3_um_filter_40_17]|nr:MAG: hypothetical protein CO119_05760 [Flavobacteriales bacterium CG_4_9_14_3_um_filter_40_17]
MLGYKMQLKVRKFHRYLAVFVGIQLLFWTVSGLYFSWNNMDDVHGDTYRKFPNKMNSDIDLSVFQTALSEMKNTQRIDSIQNIALVNNDLMKLGRISYFSENKLHHQLIDLDQNKLRSPLNETESVNLALNSFTGKVGIKNVAYLTEKNVALKHEYREKPLPAYAVTLNHDSGVVVYVAAELGEVTSFRNDNWRRFDFLWMLHTMDYRTRDNITNWVLRISSVLGLLTVLSGFLLYGLSSSSLQKIKNKKIKK